jgi:Fe-S-cluster-containing dehydrogenase component
MDCSRRHFLKRGAQALAAASVPAAAYELLRPELLAAMREGKGPRWAWVIDATKCVGCGMCVQACKLENDIPMEATASRTWIERYVVTTDGRVLIDSPKAARDGFTKNDPMGELVPAERIAKGFFVPKVCNHCENPPCVQVCPVGASHVTAEGVVLVDRSWCIGCGYCLQACPYGTRFFHPVYKTAEKCTFCYHRITKGMNPACVEACAFGARRWGDIRDPKSEVSRIVQTERVTVLKEEYGTKPHAFYLGLDRIVR